MTADSALKSFSEILALEFPSEEENAPGFLEIIKKQRNENINSNIYSYFLQKEEHPELAELFLSSLLELIDLPDKELEFDTYSCETEVNTESGRIDISINDSGNRCAVLIENKIDHWLNNDLVDYWNYYDYSDSRKQGVLLTPNEHEIPLEARDKFVNVTHAQWIEKIQEKGLPVGLPSKIYVYLNDFINTVTKLGNSNQMNEFASFYFDHPEKINKAVHAKAEAIEYVKGQIGDVAQRMNLETYGQGNSWRNIWDKKNDRNTYYTIVFDQLFSENPELEIIIELGKKDNVHSPNLTKLFGQHPKFKAMNQTAPSNSAWSHWAKKTYQPSKEEIENLASFILLKIEEDFRELMELVLTEINK